MKVVILAGGYGSRFGKATEFVPKPMIKIGSHPMLWHIMKIYSRFKYNDFIISLGYKGDVIKDYFLNFEFYENDFTVDLKSSKKELLSQNKKNEVSPWNITLAQTGLNANTGTRVKRIEKYIDDDLFMVTYGDGVAKIDIDELIRFHKSHGKIATLTRVKPPSKFGNPVVKNNQVIEFIEKEGQAETYINGGFYVFDRKIFDCLNDDDGCVLERDPLENLARDGQLMAYTLTDFWQCMDTLADMEYLNQLWDSYKAPWKIWNE